jgi:hypothetical protein
MGAQTHREMVVTIATEAPDTTSPAVTGAAVAHGAAIAVALGGHWDHGPPCPPTPHRGRADRLGSERRVRTLFAAQPELEETSGTGLGLSLSLDQRLVSGHAQRSVCWAAPPRIQASCQVTTVKDPG